MNRPTIEHRFSATAAAAIARTAASLRPTLVEVRRHLHAHPELSGRESQTARYVADRLESAGFSPRLVADGRGVIVDSPHAGDRRRIALRADLDALPIEDAKTVAYRSGVAGVMHACGHDAHAASVLGAALVLDRYNADAASSGAATVPWRAIFQPAEETNAGALAMIDAAALADAGAILGLHVDPSRRAGTIGVRAGTFTADCDELVVRVSGRGGHASRPHESIDPIAAAAQLVSSIYLFVPRGVESHESVVVTIGRIVGGESYNVIPDRVEMLGTVRSFGGPVRLRTHEHIRQLARGIAEASGTRIEVEFRPGPPSVHNDPRLTAIVREAAAEALGADRVEHVERPSMGGEDFAHYLHHVPGCMFRCGCAPPGDPAPPLHSPRFDIDEEALVVGAAVLAASAASWAMAASNE